MTGSKVIPDDLPEWLTPHAEEVASWGPAPKAPTCWVPGCQNSVRLLGLCKNHHHRAERTWRPRPSQIARRKNADEGPASDTEAGSQP